MNSTTLEITRRKSFLGSMRSMFVDIDGAQAAALKNGQTATIPLPPGTHTVSVRMGSTTSRASQIEFGEGEVVRLKCGMKMGIWAAGELVITREDGVALAGNAGPAGHHGKLLVIFGALGFLVGLLGLAAAGQGIVDLRKMDRGEMDPSGRTLTVVGMLLGAVGFLINLWGLIIKFSAD